MDPISHRPSTQSPSQASDAAGPGAAAGVQAGSAESLAQRVDVLLQIAGGLAGHEQNPAELDQAIEGLTKLIADLSADREALSGQRAALPAPQVAQVGLDPHVLQMVARFADPATKKAMRLADKNLNEAVAREVRSLTATERWGTPTAPGMGQRIPVPRLSELSAVVKQFPNLETLDLGQSQERFDSGTLAPLAGLKKLRALKIPQFHSDEDSRGLCDQLAALTQLERLTTRVDPGYANPRSNNTLTDNLLAQLTPLSQLKELPMMSLTSPQGVENLGRFPKLETLSLLMPAATDEQLESLAGALARLPLTHLSLEVDARQVTQRGVGHLQSALAGKGGEITVLLGRLPPDFPPQALRDFAAAVGLAQMRLTGRVLFTSPQALAAG